jgi:hypothetical protein
VAASGDIVLVQYDEGEEGQLDARARGLDESGDLRWESPLSIIPHEMCVTADGASYFVGGPWTPGGIVQPPRLLRLDAQGELEWEIDLLSDLSPLPDRFGLACRASDGALVISGTTTESTHYLALFDPDGMEVSRDDSLFADSQVESVSSLALREDGYLMVGADTLNNDLGVIPLVAYLSPDGVEVQRHEFPIGVSMGPWLDSAADSAAIAFLTSADNRLRVEGLGDHAQSTPLWNNEELGGTPNAMARAIASGDDGRSHVTVPNDEGSIYLVSYPADGIGELSTLRSGQDERAEPSTLGVGRTGEIIVGGHIDGTPWIAAYDI